MLYLIVLVDLANGRGVIGDVVGHRIIGVQGVGPGTEHTTMRSTIVEGQSRGNVISNSNRLRPASPEASCR